MPLPEFSIPYFFKKETIVGSKEKKQHMTLHLVRFLREWHVAEGVSRDVIDFDLAPNFDPESYEIGKRINLSPPSKTEIKEFARIIEDFSCEVEELLPANNDEKLQFDFLKAKLKASQAYCLRRLNGELAPLDYIEQTMGIRPQEIPKDALTEQEQKVRDLYRTCGLSRFDTDSIRDFDFSRMIDEASIPEQMRLFGSQAVRVVSEFTGQKIDFDYKVENVQENEYWVNWADGDRSQFRLRVNTHPRHYGRWNKGKVEVMAFHEIAGHFGQMALWRENIEKGRLLPVLGLTALHGPEQVTSEGIAQTLPYFLPKTELSNEAKLELELTGLREMVYNNVHIKVNSGLFQIQDIIQYVKRFLPVESNNAIRREVRDRTHSPLKQTYRYAYGIGFFRHQWYANNLTWEGKRRLLRFIYNQPTTPEQEHQFVKTLLQDPNMTAQAVNYQPWLG